MRGLSIKQMPHFAGPLVHISTLFLIRTLIVLLHQPDSPAGSLGPPNRELPRSGVPAGGSSRGCGVTGNHWPLSLWVRSHWSRTETKLRRFHKIWVCLKMVYPYTQWLMIIIPTKWLFHWGYTPFSDIPISKPLYKVTGDTDFKVLAHSLVCSHL